MKDAEAKWVANTPESKKIFLLKYFVVIKVEKLQQRDQVKIYRHAITKTAG